MATSHVWIFVSFVVLQVNTQEIPRAVARCYSCSYSTLGSMPWHQPLGQEACTLQEQSQRDRVDKWLCKSGVCFIRTDRNGFAYRGCADAENLDFGVVSSPGQCHFQKYTGSLWWFCQGDLCNTGQLGDDSQRCDEIVMTDTNEGNDVVPASSLELYPGDDLHIYANGEHHDAPVMVDEVTPGLDGPMVIPMVVDPGMEAMDVPVEPIQLPPFPDEVQMPVELMEKPVMVLVEGKVDYQSPSFGMVQQQQQQYLQQQQQQQQHQQGQINRQRYDQQVWQKQEQLQQQETIQQQREPQLTRPQSRDQRRNIPQRDEPSLNNFFMSSVRNMDMVHGFQAKPSQSLIRQENHKTQNQPSIISSSTSTSKTSTPNQQLPTGVLKLPPQQAPAHTNKSPQQAAGNLNVATQVTNQRATLPNPTKHNSPKQDQPLKPEAVSRPSYIENEKPIQQKMLSQSLHISNPALPLIRPPKPAKFPAYLRMRFNPMLPLAYGPPVVSGNYVGYRQDGNSITVPIGGEDDMQMKIHINMGGTMEDKDVQVPSNDDNTAIHIEQSEGQEETVHPDAHEKMPRLVGMKKMVGEEDVDTGELEDVIAQILHDMEKEDAERTQTVKKSTQTYDMAAIGDEHEMVKVIVDMEDLTEEAENNPKEDNPVIVVPVFDQSPELFTPAPPGDVSTPSKFTTALPPVKNDTSTANITSTEDDDMGVNDNPCDGKCTNNPSGLFPDPDPARAEFFIQCGSGPQCTCCMPFYLRCAGGTVFNRSTRVCTSPTVYHSDRPPLKRRRLVNMFEKFKQRFDEP